LSARIVQETCLKATQNLGQYRVPSEAELAGWLRRILTNTLADAVRKLQGAKRDVDLERSLEASLTQSSARLEALLASSPTSPSEQVLRHEQLLQLSAALAQQGWSRHCGLRKQPSQSSFRHGVAGYVVRHSVAEGALNCVWTTEKLRHLGGATSLQSLKARFHPVSCKCCA
jgi:hypothetical protein